MTKIKRNFDLLWNTDKTFALAMIFASSGLAFLSGLYLGCAAQTLFNIWSVR